MRVSTDELKQGPRGSGGLVASVAAGSPAARAGVIAGDRILTLNGHSLRDVIDYQFQLEPGGQGLELERGGELLQLRLDLGSGEEPGITFTRTLFDGVRRCRCDCPFCFVGQLPPGLRSSVYLKDDDYRLSFLHGNFTTLNNVSSEDMARIVDQRLSPLYISLHAVDPGVRAELMGCSRETAAAGIDNLRRLEEAGIKVHIQVVLCPGVNDGAVLEQTVAALADRDIHPGIASVGVVPAALADGPAGRDPDTGPAGRVALRRVTAADCEALLTAIGSWQEEYRRGRGRGFVYAADEFYLRAGRELPPPESYDGFPQFENGIGIGATFLREADGIPMQLAQAIRRPSGRVMMVTGTLAAPLLEQVCRSLNRSGAVTDGTEAGGGRQDRLDVEYFPLVAENRLFGPHVTVTGLLGGNEIREAARAAGLSAGDMLLIPYCCLESSGQMFLDGVTIREVDEGLECMVRLAPP